MDNKEHYLPWVAIWGLVFGVISGIPLLNCCCFLWFPIGALLTVMNVANKAGRTVEFAEGAILGLIVGGIAGVSSGMIGGMRAQALAGFFARAMQTWLDDEDPGLARTMAALDRQLASAERLAGVAREMCRFLPGGGSRRRRAQRDEAFPEDPNAPVPV